MRLEHPIFHTPLHAGVQLDAEPAWGTDYDDRGTWLVQTGEPGKTNDYGVVSDGHGFEDSPDAERIAGGINSKGPRAVAIGRQANMLQWGFYAAPDRMTDSAKRAFLNALVYMQKFDGHRPLVEKKTPARSWLDQYAEIVRKYEGQDDAPERTSYYRGRFPAGSGAETASADELEAWIAEHREAVYVQEGTREFLVDEDLVALGLSNRRAGFLDWMVAHATDEASRAVVERLAGRYLPQVEARGADLAAWITARKEALFFSDQGGYRWFVDPAALEGSEPAQTGGG